MTPTKINPDISASELTLQEKKNNKNSRKGGEKNIIKNTITGFTTVALSLLVAGNATASAQNKSKYKGPLTDQIKQEEISTASQTLPDTIEFGGKKVKVVYEADSGNVGSDTLGKNSFEGIKISEAFIEEFNKLSKDQQDKVLKYSKQAKEQITDPKKLTRIVMKWISFFADFNANKKYLDQKGNVGKNFSPGQMLEYTLKDIQKICPNMVSEELMLLAIEYDKAFLDFIKIEIGKIEDEVKQLKDETGKLKDETGKLKDETGKLKDETGKLKDETGKLKDDIKKLKDENKKLEESIKRLDKLIKLIDKF